ncbi:MAG: HD domain-containing protein [Planctomycetes bacterium]|nr:HD domain-containing protein [Planctomycetota bacterium]
MQKGRIGLNGSSIDMSNFVQRGGLLVPRDLDEVTRRPIASILRGREQPSGLAYHLGLEADERKEGGVEINSRSSPSLLFNVWAIFDQLVHQEEARDTRVSDLMKRYLDGSIKALRYDIDDYDLDMIAHYLTKFATLWKEFKAVEELDYGPYHSSRVQQYAGLFFPFDVLAIPEAHRTLVANGDFVREVKFVAPDEEVPEGWVRFKDCLRFVEYWIRAETAALLHDIGKIGISRETLSKAGKLNEEEWREMMQHVTIGENIVMNLIGTKYGIARTVGSIIACHHVWFDGNGYTGRLHSGKKGVDIPFSARLISICDAVDVMTRRRKYTEGVKTWEQVFQELDRMSGKQFDPELVKAFIYIGRNHPEELEVIRNYVGPQNAVPFEQTVEVEQDGVRVH